MLSEKRGLDRPSRRRSSPNITAGWMRLCTILQPSSIPPLVVSKNLIHFASVPLDTSIVKDKTPPYQ